MPEETARNFVSDATRAAEAEEASAPHQADREPSEEEEESASEAAASVDLEEVGEHYQEMTELGANIRGEGQIVPEGD